MVRDLLGRASWPRTPSSPACTALSTRSPISLRRTRTLPRRWTGCVARRRHGRPLAVGMRGEGADRGGGGVLRDTPGRPERPRRALAARDRRAGPARCRTHPSRCLCQRRSVGVPDHRTRTPTASSRMVGRATVSSPSTATRSASTWGPWKSRTAEGSRGERIGSRATGSSSTGRRTRVRRAPRPGDVRPRHGEDRVTVAYSRVLVALVVLAVVTLVPTASGCIIDRSVGGPGSRRIGGRPGGGARTPPVGVRGTDRPGAGARVPRSSAGRRRASRAGGRWPPCHRGAARRARPGPWKA